MAEAMGAGGVGIMTCQGCGSNLWVRWVSDVQCARNGRCARFETLPRPHEAW
jgi:hypothetical protein